MNQPLPPITPGSRAKRRSRNVPAQGDFDSPLQCGLFFRELRCDSASLAVFRCSDIWSPLWRLCPLCAQPRKKPYAPVAQLDRVSVFETEGWRFEPFRARQHIAEPLYAKLYRPLSMLALPPWYVSVVRRATQRWRSPICNGVGPAFTSSDGCCLAPWQESPCRHTLGASLPNCSMLRPGASRVSKRFRSTPPIRPKANGGTSKRVHALTLSFIHTQEIAFRSS